MTKHRCNTVGTGIIPANQARIKAKIIVAGLKLGQVAKAASILPAVLSQHLSGYRRNRQSQLAIWDAYRQLADDPISLEDFWGELLSKRKTA